MDFDHSFRFEQNHLARNKKFEQKGPVVYKNLEAVQSIYAIPDEMVLYVLGDAYNDLWESGIGISYEDFKDLGDKLIKRKHDLKDNVEFLKLFDKAKNNPSLYTVEDFRFQTEFVEKHLKQPFFKWVFDNDYQDLIAIFIEKFADVNAADRWGFTLLMYAAIKGDLGIVHLLLDKGADVNASVLETPLHHAVEKGDLTIVSLLLDKGADVNAKNYSNKTPLDYAVQKGDEDMINLLLDKGKTHLD